MSRFQVIAKLNEDADVLLATRERQHRISDGEATDASCG
jgi:hypothetical protein